jgi:hypothetical protein
MPILLCSYGQHDAPFTGYRLTPTTSGKERIVKRKPCESERDFIDRAIAATPVEPGGAKIVTLVRGSCSDQ